MFEMFELVWYETMLPVGPLGGNSTCVVGDPFFKPSTPRLKWDGVIARE